MSRDTIFPGVNEDYITEVSEKMERRVIKKLFWEFNRTGNRFLGAMSKLDEFLLESEVRVQSGTVQGTSRKSDRENPELNENRSKDALHPEMNTSVSSSPLSGSLGPGTVHYSRTSLRCCFPLETTSPSFHNQSRKLVQ